MDWVDLFTGHPADQRQSSLYHSSPKAFILKRGLAPQTEKTGEGQP